MICWVSSQGYIWRFPHWLWLPTLFLQASKKQHKIGEGTCFHNWDLLRGGGCSGKGHWLIGHLENESIPGLQFSPFGVIPKSQPGNGVWFLICHHQISSVSMMALTKICCHWSTSQWIMWQPPLVNVVEGLCWGRLTYNTPLESYQYTQRITDCWLCHWRTRSILIPLYPLACGQLWNCSIH